MGNVGSTSTSDGASSILSVISVLIAINRRALYETPSPEINLFGYRRYFLIDNFAIFVLFNLLKNY